MHNEVPLPKLKQLGTEKKSRNAKFITVSQANNVFRTELSNKKKKEGKKRKKQLFYPHKNLKLSNRIRKLQNKRRNIRHTSQEAIRPFSKVSFYPDNDDTTKQNLFSPQINK